MKRSLEELLDVEIPQATVANKCERTKSSYANTEMSEFNGTISLKALRKAAEALDCEVVYFLRPLQRQTPSEILWRRLYPEAIRRYRARFHRQDIKPHLLANIACKLLLETQFRRKMGWAQK